MAKVCKWRVHCLTEEENKYVNRYDSEGAPTACPGNPGHEIDAESVALVDVVSDSMMIDLFKAAMSDLGQLGVDDQGTIGAEG